MKSSRKTSSRRRGTGYWKPALGAELRSQILFVRSIDGAMGIWPCMSAGDTPQVTLSECPKPEHKHQAATR
jgi:hypothetical protein